MTCTRCVIRSWGSLVCVAVALLCSSIGFGQPTVDAKYSADNLLPLDQLTADAIVWSTSAAAGNSDAAVTTDDFGVPLRDGAVQRFGSSFFRQPNASLQHVSFLADNRTVVSFGQGTNTTPFTDGQTGRPSGQLETTDPRLRISSATASADGRYLAVSAIAFDRQTRERLPFLKLFRSTDRYPIASCSWSSHFQPSGSGLAASNDGRFVASAGPGKLVQVWRVGDAAPTPLSLGKRKVDDVLFSSDSSLLVARESDTVHVWDLAGGKLLRSLDGFKRIQAFAISDSGLLAVTDNSHCETTIYDARSGRQLYTFRPSTAATYSSGVGLVFAPGSKSLFASYASSSLLEAYSLETGKVISSFTGPSLRASDLAISPDGKLVVGGGRGCTLRVWKTCHLDVATATQWDAAMKGFHGHSSEPYGLTFSSDGMRMISVGDGGEVCLWEMGRTSPILEFHAQKEDGSRGSLTAVAISRDSKLALTLGFGVGLDLWDLESARLVYHLPPHGRTGRYGAHACGFSTDGKQFYSFGPQYYFRRWDTQTGKAILETRPYPGDQPAELDANGDFVGVGDPFGIQFGRGRRPGPPPVQVSKFSADGSKLVYLADRVYIVATNTGKITHSVEAAGAEHLAVSATGTHIATSTRDAVTIRSSNLDTPTTIESEFNPRVVAFSRDGSMLAVREHVSNAFASEAWYAVYETKAGEKLYQIDQVESRSLGCEFSPDGKLLATTRGDSTILLFDLKQFQVPPLQN